MKRLLAPLQSLTTRLLFIQVTGIVMVFMLTFAISIRDWNEGRTTMISRAHDQLLSSHIELLNNLPPESRPVVAQQLDKQGIVIRHGSIPKPQGAIPIRLRQSKLGDIPLQNIDAWVILPEDDENTACHKHNNKLCLSQGQIAANIQLSDGTPIAVSMLTRTFVPRHSFIPPWPLIAWIVAVILLAWFVVYRAVLPLKRLAHNAERLADNIDQPPIAEKGPKEVVAAAHALNTLQQRVQKNLAQRTYMLASIAHDLKTPLTRLRLRMEKITDQALQDKLKHDVQSMQILIEEGLDLARTLDDQSAFSTMDINAVLQHLCHEAQLSGCTVYTTLPATPVFIQGRPAALARVLQNLLDNGVKYGQEVTVSLTEQHGQGISPHALISFCDCGPGIPEEELDKVFEPFYRLEASRSRETGGSGLGLTIANNIIIAHGGKITLQNRTDNPGLIVTVQLPLS